MSLPNLVNVFREGDKVRLSPYSKFQGPGQIAQDDESEISRVLELGDDRHNPLNYYAKIRNTWIGNSYNAEDLIPYD